MRVNSQEGVDRVTQHMRAVREIIRKTMPFTRKDEVKLAYTTCTPSVRGVKLKPLRTVVPTTLSSTPAGSVHGVKLKRTTCRG